MNMKARLVDGREVLDPTPVEVPLHFRRPPTLQEQIKQFVRGEFSRQAADDGFDTFEEADDFEIDEDPDPISKYRVVEAQEERPLQVAPQERKSAEPAVAPSNPASPRPSSGEVSNGQD